MRECKDVIRLLKTKKYSDVNKFIYENVKIKPRKLFVGVRENAITLYYMNALVVKIQSKDNCLEYIANAKFLGNSKSEYIEIEFDDVKNNIDKILDSIENERSIKEERKLQQWILTENNICDLSEWYFVDMEYNTQGVYAGRIDLIAISKKKNRDGKHEVALIELKVGSGSIKGAINVIRERGVKRTEEEKELEKRVFKSIKEIPGYIYERQSKEVNFGSGMVGHITDYLRYLERDYFNELLRKEICNIVQTHAVLGLLPDNLNSTEIEYGDICSKPQIHFIFYSESRYGKKKCSLEQVRETVYESLFGENCESLCNIINNEDIREIINKKEEFRECNSISINKTIKGRSFEFFFSYIDGMKEESWNCLKG